MTWFLLREWGVISGVEEASGEVSEAVEMIYVCGMGEWCVVFAL